MVTTNGTQLAKLADGLYAAGVRRINVSLDTLDPEKFASITRWGKIGATLDGIFAAKAAGMAIKINAVAMKGVNEDEFDGMLAWCGDHGFDLCLIETMPMGDISGDRTEQYLPLSIVRSRLRRRWTLEDTDYRTGGPARYFNVAETGRRIGFITPMTHNFCESCNRVRLTCTGTLYMCLGQDDDGGSPHGAARWRDRRGAGRCDPRGDQPQAEGARLHHRSPPRSAGGGATYERDGRVGKATHRLDRYGIRTPGSPAGNPLASRVTSNIARTCADAHTIASGSLTRWPCAAPRSLGNPWSMATTQIR